MDSKDNQINSDENKQQEDMTTDTNTEKDKETGENTAGADQKSSEETLKAQVGELNDKYLRLYSEFDNYRKRTLKERAELIRTAAEDVFTAILPVIDDLERAIKASEKTEEGQALKEGVVLIYNKLKNICQQKGLTSFDSIGMDFNSDLMEAITHIPDPEKKGKVIDEVEKGYKLGDKVIRYAKVVVAN
jgi:molecular chaperone GrpE